MSANAIETTGDQVITMGQSTPTGASQPDWLKIVHRTLRGHYAIIFFLAVVGVIGGAWVGWSSTTPSFRSEGLVRIAFALPQVMEETDQNRPLAMFDAFLQTQQLVITSQRLVEAAMQQPEWIATGRGNSEAAVRDFAGSLAVEVRPRVDYLRISFVDRDPAVACAGVRSIINAYADAYNKQDDESEHQRIRLLEVKRQATMDHMDSLNRQAKPLLDELGPANIDPLYTALVDRVTKLETALADVRLAIAEAHQQGATGTAAASAAMPPPVVNANLADEEIAMTDAVMRNYLDERSRLQAELDRLRALGMGEAHRDVVQTKIALDRANQRIDAYSQEYRAYQNAVSHARVASGSAPTVVVGKTLADLQADEADISKLHDQAKQEMIALGTMRKDLADIQSSIESDKKSLGEINDRIEVFKTEDAMGGRLSIINNGETPLSPFHDYRPRFATAGATVMGLLPVLAAVGLGMARRKYRYSDDTTEDALTNVPLLGILPSLQRVTGDDLASTSAAHSVHQIRVMLQAKGAGSDRKVYQVTSASAGEGKSSVTMALGLSFAASGSRTLLIDGDWCARSLTRGFGAENADGLNEALRSGRLPKDINKKTEGLYVLPSGCADFLSAGTLSGGSMKRLLTDARRHFDVILIDTGPIVGSVEAAVVAPQVDGVLFTVARGQQPALVRKALGQLDSLGAQVAGCIFNRATPQDFNGSIYASPKYSDASRSSTGQALALGQKRECRFGPLVSAVIASLPSGDVAHSRYGWAFAGGGVWEDGMELSN